MRKKVITAFGLILSIFIAGSIYIIITVETSKKNLNKLITLHQVQVLRDDLIIYLERVQRDLYLKDTKYVRPVQDILRDIDILDNSINKCFTCHHPEKIQIELKVLKRNINGFTNIIRSIIKTGDKGNSLLREAILSGETIISSMNGLITRTNSNLNKRTIEIINHINSITNVLYLSLFLGLTIILIVTIRIERYLMKPFKELLKGAESFSRGDLTYRIPENLSGDFSKLAKSFNKMANDLNSHIDKLRKAEQMQLIAEVAAGLAHEIKNPLTGIKGTLEIFSKEMSLSEEDKAVFKETLFQIKKLDILTKSFLEYARPPAPQCIRACINEVINTTISFLVRNNLHKNIEKVDIVKDLDESLPDINIDPLQMQQVFLNLAINALDTMPEGGLLKFKTFHDSDSIIVEVSDTGQGLDEELKDKIFQPFFTTKTRGLGIGLSISKRFIELHGGKVMVAKSDMNGTTFRISLPVAQNNLS